MNIKLYHTSPEKIHEIHEEGLFGTALCFSAEPYTTGGPRERIIYSIEIDEEKIISSKNIFYHEGYEKLKEIVEYVQEKYGCDEERAMNLLSEAEHLENEERGEHAENSFEMQKLTALCGFILGFEAVQGFDEQGSVWYVNCENREKELKNEGIF